MQAQQVLGVDFGASGIKGAVINVHTGELLTERLRFPTPNPSTPQEIAKVFRQLARDLAWEGSIGCGFPALIKKGVAFSAANIDKNWIGVNTEALFSEATGSPVFTLNDADAAGLAEMRFGKGRGMQGVVLLITIGSGLGTCLFVDGKMFPNTELGHLILKNRREAEHYASNNARKRYKLSWEKWGKRFNEYLHYLDQLLSPDFIILGGGTSKSFELYQKYLSVSVPIAPATLLNNAGMVGAACYAWEKSGNIHQAE